LPGQGFLLDRDLEMSDSCRAVNRSIQLPKTTYRAGILLLTVLSLTAGTMGGTASALAQTNMTTGRRVNIPEMVQAEGTLRLDFGDEMLVLPRGLQPSLLRTA
jgi:hypothetical protein